MYQGPVLPLSQNRYTYNNSVCRFSRINNFLCFLESSKFISCELAAFINLLLNFSSFRCGEKFVVFLVKSKAHFLEDILSLLPHFQDTLDLLWINKDWAVSWIQGWKIRSRKRSFGQCQYIFLFSSDWLREKVLAFCRKQRTGLHCVCLLANGWCFVRFVVVEAVIAH